MANRKPRDNLTNDTALKLFGKICGEYTKRYGEMSNAALNIINDVALLEQLKQDCQTSVFEQGVMTYWRNGNGQEGYREHPLISKINQISEQQRKLLNELKITPASLKVIPPKQGADEFEAF